MPKQDKTALVPKLRFPEYRGAAGWSGEKLGSKTQKVGSGITPTGGEKNYKASGRPFVRSQNVGWGELLLDDVAFIDEETHNSFSSTQIETFDVLLNITGASIGRSAVADTRIQGGNVNQHVCIIRVVSNELSPLFLNQYLISHDGQKQIDSFQAGGNRQGLNFEQIRSFLIPLPRAFAEQQKIASCLSSVDELMAAQARKVDALKAHKKGLMQQLFPREGETQPRLRFPEFRNKADWDETTLGQLARLVRGPFGGSLKKEIFVASGHAVYEQQHAIYSDFSSFRYHITEAKFRELRRFAVAANDIIMSCSGTMGRFAIIPDGAASGVINQALLKLTPIGFCKVRFLKELLELPSVQEKLLSQSAGGAIQNVVSVDQIKALPLRLPSTDEQDAVVDCLRSLDDLIAAETQKLDALKTHKKGLMQQLFPSPEAAGA